MLFLTIPVIAWLVCGTLKFAWNAAVHGRGAFKRIGHGGFPSNHTAVISSVLCALIFENEWRAAGLALALLMVVVFDAVGLRQQISRHAAALNKLAGAELREIVGHSVPAVAAGFAVGAAVNCSMR